MSWLSQFVLRKSSDTVFTRLHATLKESSVSFISLLHFVSRHSAPPSKNSTDRCDNLELSQGGNIFTSDKENAVIIHHSETVYFDRAV